MYAWKFQMRSIYVQIQPNTSTGGDVLLGDGCATLNPKHFTLDQDDIFRRFKYIQ
jgi:hypothetical protein